MSWIIWLKASNIYIKKNHKCQFLTTQIVNQIVKDKIFLKNNNTKGSKKKIKMKKKTVSPPGLTHQTHGLGHKIEITL